MTAYGTIPSILHAMQDLALNAHLCREELVLVANMRLHRYMYLLRLQHTIPSAMSTCSMVVGLDESSVVYLHLGLSRATGSRNK